MQAFKEILNFIDSTAYVYPAYILKQIKKETTMRFISEIVAKSGKEIGESVFALLAVIRYIFKDGDAFKELQETDSFQKYIEDNSPLILDLSIKKGIQGNMPERALPILDVISKKLKGKDFINVLELGASYGLIGRCMLEPGKVIKDKERFLPGQQQLPGIVAGINHYQGIELDPPDKEWLIACIWEEGYERRLKNFINQIQPDKRFRLDKGNAFGFSELEPVREFAEKPGVLVVLTSFILYQFNDKMKKSLEDEILEFTNRVGGHWINQGVSIDHESGESEFFISWDGEKIIELPDDTCTSWRWVNGERI